MAAWEIQLKGCDDTTAFVLDLTDAEADLVERVAARSREVSEFGCMPTMTLSKIPAATIPTEPS